MRFLRSSRNLTMRVICDACYITAYGIVATVIYYSYYIHTISIYFRFVIDTYSKGNAEPAQYY